MQHLCLRSAACGLALCAYAPDILASTAEDDIERVEVTGQQSSVENLTRSSLTTQEYPQSIHVVDRDIIDSQLAIDLTDVIRNVSGIQGKASYDPMGTGLSGDYLIRGLWSESYVNGRQTFLNVGLDPATLVNVERVEVLKGTSSMLFAGGYGAPNGGIINLAEKLPEEGAAATVSLVAGSFGTWGIDADINQPLTDNWRMRVTADVTDRDINIEDVTQNVRAVYPTLLGDFDDTQIVIRGRYQHLEYDYYHGLNGATESVLDDDRVVVDTLVPSFRNIASGRIPTSEAESFGMDVSLTHQFTSQLSGSVRAGYNKADDLNHFVFFVTDTGNLRQDADIVDISADLRYMIEGQNWSSTTVLLTDHTNTNIGFTDVYNSASFGTFVTPISGSYETLNVGLQQEWVYQDRLRIVGGVTSSDMELAYTVAGAANPGIDESELNWKAGVSYDLTKQLTPFASVSYGSRLPTPTVIASAFFVGNPELETTRQTELGIKFDLADWGLTGSIVAFENDLTNAAESIDFTPLQLDQTSDGIDLDVNWQVTEAWQININYTQLDAEITEPDSPFTGNKPFNLPEKFGRLSTRYALDEVWSFGAGVTFADERTGSLNNGFFTESYELVDVQISYVKPNHAIRFGIDNLLDADHFEPVMFFGGGFFDQTQPRTFTLRATFSY